MVEYSGEDSQVLFLMITCKKTDTSQRRVLFSQDYGIEIVDFISTVHDFN